MERNKRPYSDVDREQMTKSSCVHMCNEPQTRTFTVLQTTAQSLLHFQAAIINQEKTTYTVKEGMESELCYPRFTAREGREEEKLHTQPFMLI